MLQYFLASAGLASLAAAHGMINSVTVDGTFYPATDARVDYEFPGVKRVTWASRGFSNLNGTGPVTDVASPDITCRTGPLVPPTISAVARAGSTMSIEWTQWFISHKGPVLTYMGFMPDDNVKLQDVEFFKIDEDGYYPKTHTWASDILIKNNNTRTVTIPSDIKPGTYIVRSELIALHFAWKEDKVRKTSGAQFYPNCFKVQVTGTGTSSPPGQKFPGAYNWREPGILYNSKYGPNKYDTPGPPVYKGERNPPQGPIPVVKETGALSGEQGRVYAQLKVERNRFLLDRVELDYTSRSYGTGGCHWEADQDPSTMVCVPINEGNPAYFGFAQPVGSPLYTDSPGTAMRGSKPPPASFGNEKGVKFRA